MGAVGCKRNTMQCLLNPAPFAGTQLPCVHRQPLLPKPRTLEAVGRSNVVGAGISQLLKQTQTVCCCVHTRRCCCVCVCVWGGGDA